VLTSLKAREQEINSFRITKTQVLLITKAIELLKVAVVPSLQRLGSAVMNITGAISVTNHTHLEVTKDNHSMPKLTYLGPW